MCSLRTATSDGGDFLYCGCSLIAPRVVLTAAHCVQDLRTPWVEVGYRAGMQCLCHACALTLCLICIRCHKECLCK